MDNFEIDRALKTFTILVDSREQDTPRSRERYRAFGVPYEFQPRGCLQSEKMIGGGVHGQAPGTWSDDTSMQA